MAVCPLLQADSPWLRVVSSEVRQLNAVNHKLIADLVDTMRFHDGVGLAAPQIGVPRRVIVVEYEEVLYRLVNPKVVWLSAARWVADEACLSLPGLVGPVERARSLALTALDHRGQPIELEAQDLLARVFLHEIDHLDGILYPKRMAPGTSPRPAGTARPWPEDPAGAQP